MKINDCVTSYLIFDIIHMSPFLNKTNRRYRIKFNIFTYGVI